MPTEVRILPSPFAMRRTNQIMKRGSSSGGRARAFQARGRGFDSRLPLIELGARPVLGRFAPCEPTHARLPPRAPDPVGWRDRSRGQPPAHVAQAAEHFLGKEEVTGSNPVVGLGAGRATCAIGARSCATDASGKTRQ